MLLKLFYDVIDVIRFVYNMNFEKKNYRLSFELMSTACLEHLEYHSSRSFIRNKHILSYAYFSNIQKATVISKGSKRFYIL